MTVQGSFPVKINASLDAVWPWVAQLDKHSEWSPKPFSLELVSGDANTVGSKYRSVGSVPGDSNHANEVQITEVVPNQRFALDASDENGVYHNTYDFRAVDGGTEVTYSLVFPEMKGATKYLLPILFPIVGKSDIKKRLNLLKAKAESK
jgi:uncharacterized protein YndB with AHSA1/START domain